MAMFNINHYYNHYDEDLRKHLLQLRAAMAVARNDLHQGLARQVVDLTTNAPGNGEVTWWKMGEKMLTYIYTYKSFFLLVI